MCISIYLHVCFSTHIHMYISCLYWLKYVCVFHYTQPITDRVSQNLDIISEIFTTNQNSAHGIYDWYHVMNGTNDKSHECPGTPGTKLKFSKNIPEILCRPICNRLYMCISLYNYIGIFRFIYVYVSDSQLPHVFGGWCVVTTTHAMQMTVHLISVRHCTCGGLVVVWRIQIYLCTYIYIYLCIYLHI